MQNEVNGTDALCNSPRFCSLEIYSIVVITQFSVEVVIIILFLLLFKRRLFKYFENG